MKKQIRLCTHANRKKTCFYLNNFIELNFNCKLLIYMLKLYNLATKRHHHQTKRGDCGHEDGKYLRQFEHLMLQKTNILFVC